MKNYLYILLILIVSSTSAQVGIENEEQDPIQYQGIILDTIYNYPHGTAYSGVVNLRGHTSLGERLPFWMWKNKRGRVSEDTNFSGWITGKALTYVGYSSFLEVGAGILFQDGTSEGAVPDELYAHFQNSWLQATLGRKQRPSKYSGISASNENILWSVNSRPLPGIQLSTSNPIFILGNRGLGFEASWNEYLLGKDRYLQGARLHQKSFHLLYRTNNNFQIKAGFLHFAHWGGSNPKTGEERPKGFQDYLDVLVPKDPFQNHLSSYEIYLSKKFIDFRLELLYNHIATDQSGRRFGNTPDGRYGIFYETFNQDKLINAMIYEFYYTQHQSYDRSGWTDDYFNHFAYKSGWTYKDRILGAPFFEYDTETQRVVNNKFTAHHIGLRGQYTTLLNSYPYEVLLSYSRNDGVYDRRFRPKQNLFSTYFDVRVLQSFVDVNVQFATEFNTYTSPNYGGAVHLKYNL